MILVHTLRSQISARTMTLMTMDDKLILRDEQFDQNHQQIFDAIDILALGTKSGREKAVCYHLATVLLSLARQNFTREESLMTRHCYQPAAMHIEDHCNYIGDVLAFMSKLESTDYVFPIDDLNRLRNGLSTHINQYDRALVAELRNRNYWMVQGWTR